MALELHRKHSLQYNSIPRSLIMFLDSEIKQVFAFENTNNFHHENHFS